MNAKLTLIFLILITVPFATFKRMKKLQKEKKVQSLLVELEKELNQTKQTILGLNKKKLEPFYATQAEDLLDDIAKLKNKLIAAKQGQVIDIKLIANLIKSSSVKVEQLKTDVIANANMTGKKYLRVGLYPYIPDFDFFKKVLMEEWAKINPEVELIFVDWDVGTHMSPGEGLDVFTFQNRDIRNFRSKGYLQAFHPSQVKDIGDFSDIILDSVSDQQGNILGIPQYLCMHFLVYKKKDKELASAQTVDKIFKLVRSKGGLLSDIYSLELLKEILTIIAYEWYHTLDSYPQETDSAIFDMVKELLGLIPPNAKEFNQNDSYFTTDEMKRFLEGEARAYYGAGDTFYPFTQNDEDLIDFHLMHWSKNLSHTKPLIFVDCIGINPAVQKRGLLPYAIELANILSSEIILKYLTTETGKNYRYLVPARTSILEKVAALSKIFARLKNYVETPGAKVATVSEKFKKWVDEKLEALCNLKEAGDICLF